MRILLLALTVFICACCASSPDYVYMFNSRPMSPEGWYEDLYDDTKACAKKLKLFNGNKYEDIQWFMAPPGSMKGGEYVGLSSKPNRIYIDAGYALEGWLIQHELSHYVLPMPHSAHESPAFALCSQYHSQRPDTAS